MITDNGIGYRRKRSFTSVLVKQRQHHTRSEPYRPQTNGKAERYNRTLLDEWAYARPYRSETARTRALDKWLLIVQPSPVPHGHRGNAHRPSQQPGGQHS